MTDQQIISLFHARDERALSEVSARYAALCMRVVRSHLQSTEDAEECVSDVMMKLWQQIPPAEPVNLEAFIVTLAQRTAIDKAKRMQAQKRGGGIAPASLEVLGDSLAARETVEDARDRVLVLCAGERRLLTAAVERFLDVLSDDDQTIFVERYHNETAPRDIARKFGLSGVHVRKSLMRTRRRLKAFLKEEGLL